MTYDNVTRVLYILLFIGIMICEIIYFLRVRKDYKCIIDLAKSEIVISEVKSLYHEGMLFLIAGVALLLYGIFHFFFEFIKQLSEVT